VKSAVRSLNAFVANKPAEPLDWLNEVDTENYTIADLKVDCMSW
jgi:hypothetical protein